MKSTVPEAPQRIQIKPSKTDGILNYDIDNAYPQRVSTLVNASGQAKSCTRLFAKFIVGGGFKDKGFYKAKVNRRGLTADKLARMVISDYAKYYGVAIHVNYNLMFEISEVNYMPFDWCRLPDEESEHPGKIAVYEDWGKHKKKNINRDKIEYFDKFNTDPLIIAKQIEACGGIENYNGQIYWWSNDGDCYPLAPIDPVIEDVQTDIGTKNFRKRSVTTSFMASHIIEYPYEFESEEEREGESKMWGNMQGTENANKLVIIENKDSKDKPVRIHKIELQNNDKIFDWTDSTAKKSIVQQFLQPAILLNIQDGSGVKFSNDEITEAYSYYNNITQDDRLIIEEIFRDIFSRFSQAINPTNDYTILWLNYRTSQDG
jgi:hypothetical protein